MKTFITVIFTTLLLALTVKAQEIISPSDEEISIDLLRGPVSPAASLLGISNSQIEKPSDPAAFMASIYTASDNFTTLPSSYAVDIAPAWIFGGDRITINDFMSSKPSKSILQSFVLSLATTTTPNSIDSFPGLTRFSAGIKFSIFRGEVDDESREKLERLHLRLVSISKPVDSLVDDLRNSNGEYLSLAGKVRQILDDPTMRPQDKADFTRPMRERMAEITDSLLFVVNEIMAVPFAEIRSAAEEITFYRYGFKLDLAGGCAWDFPGMNFSKGSLSNAGAWLTGGWDGKKGFTALGLLRYLYYPDLMYLDNTDLINSHHTQAFDAGLRMMYSRYGSRFAFSLEGLYRSMLDVPDIDPTWRFTVNAEYDIGKNKKLTFIFGRDFDGTITGDGNVIAALNLLLGFGTGKSLK